MLNSFNSMSGDEPAVNKWANALKRDVEWTKDDLTDVIYWIRQVLGLVIGVIYGALPVTGFVGHVSFAFLNALILYVYYAKYLCVDDEELGRWELVSEGFSQSYGMFLLAWITVYTVHLEWFNLPGSHYVSA